MTRLPGFVALVVCVVLLSPFGFAQNLKKYRDFEFGMSFNSVVEQTQADPAAAKTISATPELVQTLQWNRPDYFSSSTQSDPVRSIRFDFYNDRLFKIVAMYGARELEGMTTTDLIDAISKVYGLTGKMDEGTVLSSYTGYEDRQKVLARWEDGEISYNLFRSSYGGEYGLVAFSKSLDRLASASIREGERLDAKALERQQELNAEQRKLSERARAVPPDFLP